MRQGASVSVGRSVTLRALAMAGVLAVLWTAAAGGPLGPRAEANTLHGSTGLITSPNADVLSPGELALGYHLITPDPIGVAFASYSPLGGVEFGLASSTHPKSPEGLVGHLKWQVFPESDAGPAVAVGLEGGGSANLYAVLSKSLGLSNWRGHAGVSSGRFLFLGVSTVLNPVAVHTPGSLLRIPITELMVEYDGSGMNAGLRMGWGGGLRVDVGLIDMERLVLGVQFKTHL